MPLYEYSCETCRRDFEALVRSGDVPRCPQCGGSRLERLLSVPAAHTRGAASSSLPVCNADAGPPCGPGFCRTGQCSFD